MHAHNTFATLTYDEKHYTPSLDYDDIQKWLKRVRKNTGQKFRYFVAGEYGDETGRAHWHALIFGLRLDDRKKYSDKYWTSATLTETWKQGQVLCGDVTYQSAAYCAKYAFKKRTGEQAKAHYQRPDLRTGEIVDVTPEMAHMSTRPALGKTWFEKYWRDVFAARDAVVMNGKELPPPTYYRNMLRNIDSDLADERDWERYVKSEQFMKDCTPERLATRERVAKAREKLNKRRLG